MTDPTKPDPMSFSQFMTEVSTILSEAASAKGYNAGGPDSDNHLFHVTGIEHACGEIVYKAIRYRKRRDPTDMVKAAAWAYLAWKHRDIRQP